MVGNCFLITIRPNKIHNWNKPKAPSHEMDDQLPQSEQEWSQRPATDFDPQEYEQQLGQNDYK